MKLRTLAGTEINVGDDIFVVHVPEVKEIRPKPLGKVRLRLRYGEYASAFVRTETECSKHGIVDLGTHWELLPAEEINITVP